MNDLTDQVKFIGYTSDSDLYHYFKHAFALVMPSFYGPTNIPPIEAILLDCPPIVSNNYGMPDQFEDAALYINPSDPVDIANAIGKLLTDPDLRDNLLKKGNRIKPKFSQERFISDLQNIFLNLNLQG